MVTSGFESLIHHLLLERTNSDRIFAVAEHFRDSAEATAILIFTLTRQEITG
jgi:hypothetical protein